MRCSDIKIITKFYKSSTGYEITYKDNGDIQEAKPIDKDKQGTIISIRNIHKGNKQISQTYKKNKAN